MARSKKQTATGKPKGRGRRSKAEDMTGAKENAVEVRTIGDNSKLALAAPDDYAHHLKTMRGILEKEDTVKKLKRQAKEAANKCAPGLAASVALTLKIETENDPVKLQQRLEHLGLGLKIIDFPVQLSVFDSLGGDVEDQAYKRGLADGKAARPSNNKYPDGSALAAKYADGWMHGTASNMGMSADETDAALQGETIQ